MYECCSIYKRNAQSLPDVPYEMHQSIERRELSTFERIGLYKSDCPYAKYSMFHAEFQDLLLREIPSLQMWYIHE